MTDVASDGFGKVGLFSMAQGETTNAKAVSGFADVDLYQMVDDISVTTLTAGSYAVKVSNMTWDFGNADYAANIASFKVIDHTGLVLGEQTSHMNFVSDTVNITTSSSSDYFVQVTGTTLADAQYEITFDVI